MSEYLATCNIKLFQVLPDATDIIRDGGTFVCGLRGPDGKDYELVFPVLEEYDPTAPKALNYAHPQIHEGTINGPLIRKLSWAEARALLEHVAPVYQRNLQVMQFTLMKEIALTNGRNAERQA